MWGELLCKINFLVHVRALCETLVVRMGNKINKIIGLEVIDTYIFRQSIIFLNYSTFIITKIHVVFYYSYIVFTFTRAFIIAFITLFNTLFYFIYWFMIYFNYLL